MKTHTSKVWNMDRVTPEQADVCLVIKREKGQVMEIAAVAEQATVIYWVQFALLSFFFPPPTITGPDQINVQGPKAN